MHQFIHDNTFLSQMSNFIMTDGSPFFNEITPNDRINESSFNTSGRLF